MDNLVKVLTWSVLTQAEQSGELKDILIDKDGPQFMEHMMVSFAKQMLAPHPEFASVTAKDFLESMSKATVVAAQKIKMGNYEI